MRSARGGTTRGHRTDAYDRSRPRKPNSPWADVGDAFAYLAGWLRPGLAREQIAEEWRRGTRVQRYALSSTAHAFSTGRRPQ